MKKIFTILSIAFATIANAQVTITPSATAICQGNSVTLIAQVTGASADTLNFIWFLNGSPISVPNNDTITVTVGGNYSVNVLTNQSLLIGNDNQNITVNTNPTATATNTGPYCVGGTIQLNAGGGNTYAWVGPNGFNNNNQNPQRPAQTANAGTYTVTVTNANGCSATATTNVVVNTLPTASITVSPNDTVCQGTTVALFATGGTSYLWSTNTTNSSITVTPTVGNNNPFTVQVTDANGCQATATQNIVVRPNPTVNAIGTNVSCFGGNNGSATAYANIGAPFTYAWNTLATTQTINGLTPNIYSVTVTNSFGCTASDTATVGQPAVLTATMGGHTNVSCFGGSNGIDTVLVTGGTAPYSFSWTGSGSGNNPRTNLASGVYTVTVSDANGCSDTSVVTITQPLTLTANADSTPVTCFGDSNGTAFVSFINGGVAPYVYVWNNNQTGSSISNLPAGNYTAIITDANGCIISTSTAVTQPSQVGLSFTQTNATCNGSNNGSITVTGNGGITGNYQYKLNSNNWTSNNTFSNLTAGTYTIMARDANQCTAGPTTVIITQPNALQANMGSTPQGCSYLGQAWVVPSGGVGPYSFQWSNSLGTNDSIIAATGNYTVTITDANNCQTLGIAAIATPQPVSITGTVTNPTCFGGSNGSINITVTGVAPLTYLWSNGDTTQDITGLGAPSSLTVIITAANGCLGSSIYSLVNPAPLSVSSNDDTTNCFGSQNGSLTALATGGTGSYGFAWSPSGGNGNTAYGLGAGIYTVIVTDANGCQATDQGQVFNAPQLAVVINSVTNSQCAGSNTGAIDISVTGGSGLLQYYWFGPNVTGSPSQDISNLTPGNYSVNITDANGCVLSSPSIIVGGGTQVITAYFTAVQNTCSGQNNGAMTINASGGTPPFSYQWSNGDTTAVNNNLAAGNYTVTITDAVGCIYGPLGQTLVANPAMNISIPAELTNYCVGSGVPQGLNISGGTYPYSTQWENPNGVIFATSDQIEPLMSGIYTATVIDGLSCSQIVYVPVTLVTCTSGINDLSSENITIFPNPTTSGRATLSLPSTIHDVNIDVKNITGQSVFHAQTNDAQYTINTSSLAAGTYIVQIASRDKVITKKLVVQ